MPEKLTKALKWLEANNLSYADIEIADDWVESALADNEELFMNMLGQPKQPECMDTGDSIAEHTIVQSVLHGVGNIKLAAVLIHTVLMMKCAVCHIGNEQ